MLHLWPMPMTKRFHCMKLVESIMVRISVLTNNLCYPRISKKLMFCPTSDQYLIANIITCLSDGLKLLVFEVFVNSLELKTDVLPTNSCVTHEFDLHDPLKIAPYMVSSGGCFVIHWTSDSIASTVENLSVFYNCF